MKLLQASNLESPFVLCTTFAVDCVSRFAKARVSEGLLGRTVQHSADWAG